MVIVLKTSTAKAITYTNCYGALFIMNQFDLKSKFTEEFFEEFQFDAEFRSIFESMTRGLTPYEAIEHLCKSKKELFKSLERAIENTPQRIIVTPERFEQLKG